MKEIQVFPCFGAAVHLLEFPRLLWYCHCLWRFMLCLCFSGVFFGFFSGFFCELEFFFSVGQWFVVDFILLTFICILVFCVLFLFCYNIIVFFILSLLFVICLGFWSVLCFISFHFLALLFICWLILLFTIAACLWYFWWLFGLIILVFWLIFVVDIWFIFRAVVCWFVVIIVRVFISDFWLASAYFLTICQRLCYSRILGSQYWRHVYYFGLYVIIIGFLGVTGWPFNDSKLIYKICESIFTCFWGDVEEAYKGVFFLVFV